MKIKRFFAPDIRQAIRMVRDEQGPDAVILSNTKVDGGVEIVAAVDYDESLYKEIEQESAGAPSASGKAKKSSAKVSWAQEPTLVEMRREMKSLRGLLESQLSGIAWGEMARRQPQRARLIYSLREIGLSQAVANQIASKINPNPDFDAVWRQALGVLAHHIQVTDDDILTNGGVVALVGPTGVGKTTTVAKLAARFVLRHGARNVGLITIDSYRIGAHEQLRTYGRILGLPVKQASNASELRDALQSFRDKRLVLIDTAGMGQRDQRLAEQLLALENGAPLVKNYLVLSATTQTSGLMETVRAFKGSRLNGCIFTKLDEATGLGSLLSVVIQHQLSVAYVSEGQRVPEDLSPARAPNLISSGIAQAQRSAQLLKKSASKKGTKRMTVNALV